MRKKTKIFIKLSSFMLALVTLFCILPLTAFADEPSKNVVSENSDEAFDLLDKSDEQMHRKTVHLLVVCF